MDPLKKLHNLLENALVNNASDLHISVGHPPILRITRALVDMKEEKIITTESVEQIAFCLMSVQQKDKFLKQREIDFAYDFNGKARFRVNVFFQKNTISIALRCVPSQIKTIEELNLPAILHKFIEARQGLVLVTGSTSQGKSTTLAAMVDEINYTRREHIIIIEDPIEYIFKDDKSLIHQREIYRDARSFPSALRAALREDPDVIMVGEMRDLETIATAITAAETGHLVLATLHTNSASQTIHRIIDVFPPHKQSQTRAQLSASLLGVISQRLVPTIEGEFRPACEIMFANSAITNLIRTSKIHEIPAIIETSANEGMQSLNKALSNLVEGKVISQETALSYSLNPIDLSSRLEHTRTDLL